MKKQDQIAISIKGVSKLYRLQKQHTFKELLPAIAGGQKVVESFWSINDINLEIKKGESLGIIGPNGSGKSTLLKLIAGVTKPTKGKININGNIAPLIELGAGFHPELTGKENVFLNGIILGLSKMDVSNRFNEIVDFAELWEFIDQPVKHFSSGMYLRLAFSVAIHANLDILLVDEILAVGDHEFQKKCLKKIEELKEEGITIIVVSHSEELITKYTKKAILLKNGKIVERGDSKCVVSKFFL